MWLRARRGKRSVDHLLETLMKLGQFDSAASAYRSFLLTSCKQVGAPLQSGSAHFWLLVEVQEAIAALTNAVRTPAQLLIGTACSWFCIRENR